ncbi:MAG: hypothetical protein OXU69_00675 [Gemmatimonadota bacterium]|nr:hypothetical protein [Gemmatimonadota bacterium]
MNRKGTIRLDVQGPDVGELSGTLPPSADAKEERTIKGQCADLMVGTVHGEDATSGGVGPHLGCGEKQLFLVRVSEAVFVLCHPGRMSLADFGAPILTARNAPRQHDEQERR